MDAKKTTSGILTILLLTCSVVAAQTQTPDGVNSKWDGYAFLSSYFDDNVFKYSAVDREFYESGLPTGDKFPIESLSDNVITLALRADYKWNLQRKNGWRARLLFDHRFYASNTDKSYSTFGVALRRNSDRAYVDVSAGYTPDFYLRHLYWRPMPERPAGVTYAAATFDKSVITADGRMDLSERVEGQLTAQFAHRDYNAPFDERDNDAFRFIAGVHVDVTPRLRTSLLSMATIARAKGGDMSDPDVTDISNNTYGFAVEGNYRLNRWFRLGQSFGFNQQVYTTKNVNDAAHYDRRDDEYMATTTIRAAIHRGWQPKVFFQYRTSDSTTPPGIAEIGEYESTRFGLQLTYYLP